MVLLLVGSTFIGLIALVGAYITTDQIVPGII